jgi:hypothetical protein
VARPRRFELGSEASVHPDIERFVLDGELRRVLRPVAEGFVQRKAIGTWEGLLRAGEDMWRQGWLLASWSIEVQEGGRCRTARRSAAPEGSSRRRMSTPEKLGHKHTD